MELRGERSGSWLRYVPWINLPGMADGKKGLAERSPTNERKRLSCEACEALRDDAATKGVALVSPILLNMLLNFKKAQIG